MPAAGRGRGHVWLRDQPGACGQADPAGAEVPPAGQGHPAGSERPGPQADRNQDQRQRLRQGARNTQVQVSRTRPDFLTILGVLKYVDRGF